MKVGTLKVSLTETEILIVGSQTGLGIGISHALDEIIIIILKGQEYSMEYFWI